MVISKPIMSSRRTTTDVWLSDGGGMAPNRSEYMEFLKTAFERRTVSSQFCPISTVTEEHADADADADDKSFR